MRIFGQEQTWRQIIANFLMAALLATMLWTWAQFEQNPNERRVYHVSLEARNLDPDMLLLNPQVLDKGVMVTILAPQSVLRAPLPDDALEAWVDLAGLPPGRHTVPVHVVSHHRLVRILRYDPQAVEVELDRLLVREVPVRPRFESALVAAFRDYEIRVTPSSVRASGPARDVRRVAEAQAPLQITDDHALPERVTLVPVDTQGNPVPNVELTPAHARILLEKSPGRYREVPIRVVLKGQPAPGYHIAQVMVDPPLVTLYDPTGEIIDDVMFVETEPVNINGASGPVTNKVPLQIPEGLEAVDTTEARVEVVIEPFVANRFFDAVPVRVEGLAQGLVAEVQPQYVSLQINGPEPKLNELNPATDIQVVVDVTNLSVGEYTLEPQVRLHEDFSVAQMTPPTVKVVLRLEATPTPTPTPTQTPTATP
ncbi:MAG: hypothetical protein GXO54_07515 [Chloroflexi bacterium]|nr:hypothetical protein [Chloroflexota bacterium]